MGIVTDRLLVKQGCELQLPIIKDSSLGNTRITFLTSLIEYASDKNGGMVTRTDFLQYLSTILETQGKKPLTNARVGQLLNEFTKLGAFEKHRIPEDSLNCYILKPELSKFFFTLELNKQKKKENQGPTPIQVRKDAAVQRMAFIASCSVEFLNDSPTYYFAERLMSGILDTAMRTGRNDKRRKIMSRYPLPVQTDNGYTKEYIGISSTCRSDSTSQIMELSDMALVHALNSRFIIHIRNQYGDDPDISRIQKRFVFDILDLCDDMGFDAAGRANVVKRLQRLRDTVFKLDVSDAPYFREVFGYQGIDLSEYQYLTSFDIATEEIVQDILDSGHDEALDAFRRDSLYQSELQHEIFSDQRGLLSDHRGLLIDAAKNQILKRVPRYYYVTFNDRQFQYLISQARSHRFLIHNNILKERHGITQRFYSWAKASIGVRSRKPRPEYVEYLLDEFHVVCLQTAEYSTFVNELYKMVQINAVEGNLAKQQKTTALIHGYYLEVDPTEEGIAAYKEKYKKNHGGRGRKRICPVVKIYRNKDDELIGDNSLHNQALQQRQLPLHG